MKHFSEFQVLLVTRDAFPVQILLLSHETLLGVSYQVFLGVSHEVLSDISFGNPHIYLDSRPIQIYIWIQISALRSRYISGFENLCFKIAIIAMGNVNGQNRVQFCYM